MAVRVPPYTIYHWNSTHLVLISSTTTDDVIGSHARVTRLVSIVLMLLGTSTGQIDSNGVTLVSVDVRYNTGSTSVGHTFYQ